MAAPIPDEQAALLAAIVAEPDDDTPRLVYADWLQERGDEEQAEFIRDSIRLARSKLHDGEMVALTKRLRAIAYERGDQWVRTLGVTCTTNRFERGFPIRVTFDGTDEFFAMAEPVFEWVPIRGLQISAFGDSELGDDDVERLIEMPALTRLTDLRLVDQVRIGPEGWSTLFHAPHLPRLEYLSLSGCGIRTDETRILASAAALAGLVDLDLSHNSIGVGGARAVLESPYLRQRLELLWLQDNFLGYEDGEEEVQAALAEWLGDGLFVHGAPDEDEEELV